MNTIARLKQGKHNFEIIVDMDRALNYKKGMGQAVDFLEADRVFTDSKKGMAASSADLNEAFGTEDVNSIAEKIVKKGEVLVSQEHRDEEKEKKMKQVVDFLTNNSFDPQTKRPHTPERIKSALEQARVNIKNVPVESQINDIVSELNKIIPIRIETKKIKLTIPAVYTGKIFGVINQYKENENWLSDGTAEITVNVPSGVLIDFYDKINSITHGSVLTEELKE